VTTYYNLCDQAYVPATVVPEDKVCLWLGASVMLEYTYDEAHSLLTLNHRNAEVKLVRLLLLPRPVDLPFVAGHPQAPQPNPTCRPKTRRTCRTCATRSSRRR